MCQKSTKPVEESEANAILRYWEENAWPNIEDWSCDVI
jgi:hypothetical protein